uniref:uncharacterized protein isoform X1 n=1 Tax=Myxine glutinosa TaxID=7769 RepID=UPI00358FC0C3
MCSGVSPLGSTSGSGGEDNGVHPGSASGDSCGFRIMNLRIFPAQKARARREPDFAAVVKLEPEFEYGFSSQDSAPGLEIKSQAIVEEFSSKGEVDSMETGSYLENVPPTSNEALSRVCVKEEPCDSPEGDITTDSIAAYEASELLTACSFDDSNIDEASESPVPIPTSEVHRSEDAIRNEVQAGIFAAGSTVESPVKTPGKRVQHHKDWNDVKRKRLRNSGQEYFGRNGVVHEARKMKDLTNHKCSRQCHLISEDERKQLFQQYWALADYNAQVSWICGAIKQVVPKRRYSQNRQDPRKGYTRIFHMTTAEKGSLTVCKTFFLTTLSISNGAIDRALKKQRNNDGMPATDQRGQHAPPNKLAVDELEYIKQHISSFPRYCSHYTWEHLGDRSCLAPEINLRRLYLLYQEKCREDGRQPLKEWVYRNTFRTTRFDLPPTSEGCTQGIYIESES